MSKKVIVAGHICLDITPVFPAGKKKSISEVMMPGKLVQMKAASVSTGGAVANTGLAMKILGANVKLMGKVGTDAFGDMVCSIMDRYDAGEAMIRAEGEATSYTVVVAVPGIDRVFLHCPGANDTFRTSEVDLAELEDTALFHFGYPPIMASMYQNEGEELLKLMKKAREAGCATSMDLAAVDPDSGAGKVDWKAILTKVIPYVDFFVPSIEEVCYMLDRERLESWQERAGGGDITEILDLDKDIRPLADQCMELGCKVLLLKCGAPGIYYRTATRDKLESIAPRLGLDASVWADKEGFEKSYKPDAVLSGTGAGDTSIAAFLTAMLEGSTPEECVQLATATGACCVAAYDSLSGLKPLSELRQRIADGWEKAAR